MFAVVAAVVVSGCSVGAEDLTCEFKTSNTCGEWSNVALQYRSTIETLCRGTDSKFTTGHNCPAAGRIGGCSATSSEGDGLTWYYPSDTVKTLADVNRECGAEKKLVGPDGKVADVPNLQCSMPGTATVVVHFVNKRANEISVFYRDSTCMEVFKTTVTTAPPMRQLLAAKSGDVFVVREGDGGTQLKEVIVGTNNPQVIDIDP